MTGATWTCASELGECREVFTGRRADPLHLARLLLDSGQRDAAVRHLGQALVLGPSSDEALELLGRVSDPSPVAEAESESEDVLAWLDGEFEGIVPPMFVDGGAPIAGDGGGDSCAEGCCSTARRVAARALSPARLPVS
jgi:tetratricopeptide repeat protein